MPPFEGPVTPTILTRAFNAVANERKWLDTVSNAVKKGSLGKNEWVPWPAYHASIQTTEIPPAAIITLLPLFVENTHLVAMIKHSMDVVKVAGII